MGPRAALIALLVLGAAGAVVVGSPTKAVAGGSQNERAELRGEQLQALATTLPDFRALLKKRPSELPSRKLKDYSVEVTQNGAEMTVEYSPEHGAATGGGVIYRLRRPFLTIARRLLTK
jgi:hypothetical protein